MTRTEIEALEGRALDAAVAEQVFGWRPDPRYEGIMASRMLIPDGRRDVAPCYHEDWSTIPLIVEAMERYTYAFTLQKGGHRWYADFLWAPVCNDSAPTAVCRAALLVLGEVNDG